MASDRHALVLLVDDDPSSLKLLSEALAGQPITLAVAIDGEMALRQIRREVPDLVLLDAVMPGLSGFEVCRRLKEDPATRGVPVLFMTVLSDTASRVRGLELGAVDYVSNRSSARSSWPACGRSSRSTPPRGRCRRRTRSSRPPGRRWSSRWRGGRRSCARPTSAWSASSS
ncbi:hypothetical protein BE21_53600 [Sorangium cellulosum]|uniref:Response regulatory domain-containing protein n=1 Tax=Sorangium cellulosum TaxID=56 RepID=A0A150TEB3_SORCE|nr:hypothetical protein BE21_53600 [Sorangium cellulosum]